MYNKIISISWNLSGKGGAPRFLETRVITPCTIEPVVGATHALSLEVSARVMETANSQLLFLGTSSSCNVGVPSDEGFSLPDLLRRLRRGKVGEATKYYAAVNTSRSRSWPIAVERVFQGLDIMRMLSLVDEVFRSTLVKLEVYNQSTHSPKDDGVMRAFEILELINSTRVNDPPIEMMPFITKRPDLAGELARNRNCAALRIFGSTIGEGRGLGNRREEDLFCEIVDIATKNNVPVIAEGGLATPKHVYRAIELGASAVLVNSALIHSRDPVKLAKSLRTAADKALADRVKVGG